MSRLLHFDSAQYRQSLLLRNDVEQIINQTVFASAAKQSHEPTCYHEHPPIPLQRGDELDYIWADCFTSTAQYRQSCLLRNDVEQIMNQTVFASAAKQSHEATCYHEWNYPSADCHSRSKGRSFAMTTITMKYKRLCERSEAIP